MSRDWVVVFIQRRFSSSHYIGLDDTMNGVELEWIWMEEVVA